MFAREAVRSPGPEAGGRRPPAGRAGPAPSPGRERALGNRLARRLGVQARLTVGPADDPFEREADRVAEQVVAAPAAGAAADPAAPPPVAAPAAGRIQRQAEAGENEPEPPPEISFRLPAIEEAAERVQTQRAPASAAGGAPGAAGGAVDGPGGRAAIDRATRGGERLPAPVRSSMESHFGVDFGGVRVHADGAADAACKSLSARAFTLGRDIAFARGEYRPETRRGRKLLAHELTHVVQQGAEATPVVRRQVSCLPGSATPYAADSSPSYNCYAYALADPSLGVLLPGVLATGRPFGGLDLFSASTYTAANVRDFTEQDLSDTLGGIDQCCTETSRIVHEVVSDDATSVAVRTVGSRRIPVPKVGTKFWDFHWYRQDADGYFSHKRGRSPTRRDDASGNDITHPATADRGYSTVDYPNYLGNFCLP
jgi:hypothetical protein